MINPNEVYEKYRIAGEAWAKANGEAIRLEEMRKSVRAQLMSIHIDKPISKAEMLAESDDRYISHIEEMVVKRTEANIKRAEYDALKAWIDITRTLESTRRAELNRR